MRPPARPSAAPYSVAASGGGVGVPQWFPTQLVVDPGFSDDTKWTLTGTGIGLTAVTGGVLQITSVTDVYFILPATTIAPLLPGVYTVTFTVLNYVAGRVGTIFSTSSALSGGTVGPQRTGNGTFTETLTLPLGGYIGLGGQGTAIVNDMQVDNMTIVRAA